MGFFDKFGSSIISAGGGLLGGLFGLGSTKMANDANLQAVRETNAANRELARYNWEQQVDMWNRNNEYNSPIQQMQRLKEAGLNPNLVYGSGVTGNSSSSIPTPQMPTQEAPHFEKYDTSFIAQSSDAAVRAYQQQRQIDSQLSLNKSQESAIQSQNLVNNAKIAEIMTRNARGKFDLDLAKDLRQNSVEAAMLSTNQMKQKLAIGEEELKNFPIQRAKMKSEISLMEANRNLSVKQAERISSEIWKISQEIVNFGVQRGLWQSQTRLNNANADRTDLSTSYDEVTFSNRVASMAQDLTNAVTTGNIKKLEYLWKNKYGFSTDQVSQIANSFGYQIDGTINYIKSLF